MKGWKGWKWVGGRATRMRIQKLHRTARGCVRGRHFMLASVRDEAIALLSRAGCLASHLTFYNKESRSKAVQNVRVASALRFTVGNDTTRSEDTFFNGFLDSHVPHHHPPPTLPAPLSNLFLVICTRMGFRSAGHVLSFF